MKIQSIFKVLLILALALPNMAFSQTADTKNPKPKPACGLACKAAIGYVIYKYATKDKKEEQSQDKNTSEYEEDYSYDEDCEDCEDCEDDECEEEEEE